MKKPRSILLLLLFAFLGWAWCAVIMAVGPAFLSMDITLVVHAALGPLVFALLSGIYARKYPKPKPIGLAILMVLFVILMDAGFVAPFVLKSFEMFESSLGTWIPFGLIFFCTLVGGRIGAGGNGPSR